VTGSVIGGVGRATNGTDRVIGTGRVMDGTGSVIGGVGSVTDGAGRVIGTDRMTEGSSIVIGGSGSVIRSDWWVWQSSWDWEGD
jgi:hypothetical protein